MKNTLPLLIALFLSSSVFAQAPDISARSKEEMKKLSYLAGDWKGEAIYRNAKGTIRIQQEEHIEWKLQGLVLAIEGTGKQKNTSTSQDETVFQAFAVVNFDQVDQQFKFKSFVKEGYSTDAYFKVLEENRFEWGFDIASGGKIRYTISLDPIKKTWHEVGEYTPDGTTWLKTIELNLKKLNE